jgi:Mn-dependent DtxR family transcriptional regulator
MVYNVASGSMGKVVYLKSADAKGFLTVEEAAEELDIKPQVVRNYLSQGRFITYKFKTLSLLASGDVRAYRGRMRGK